MIVISLVQCVNAWFHFLFLVLLKALGAQGYITQKNLAISVNVFFNISDT